MSSPRPLRLLLLLGLASLASPSRAEEDPDLEIAQRHVDKGRKLFEAKGYAKALDEFEAAELTKSSLSTQLLIGRCYERLGRTKEAFKSYLKVLDATSDPKLEAEARQLINDLKAAQERGVHAADVEGNKRFDKAVKLFEAKSYDKALLEFEAARAVKPVVPNLDYHVARCLDRLERYRDAITAYERFLATAADAFEREAAQRRVETLKARVAVIEAKAGAKAEAKAEAKARPAAAPASDAAKPATAAVTPHGDETGPIDPGDPLAPRERESGKPPRDEEARLPAATPAAAATETAVAASEDEPAEPAPATAATASPAAPASDQRPGFFRAHVIPLSVGAGAVVLIGVGLGVALSTNSGFREFVDFCAPQCDPADWQGLRNRERAGQGLIAIGLIAAAVDIGLWVWELKFKSRRPPRAWLLPSGAGLAAGGSF